MFALLESSQRILRSSPGMFLALGAAVVISLCSVCGGIGLLLAPWFVCELASLQLEAHGRRAQPRGKVWILAGVVVLGMVLVMASAGWLAALSFGPDVASADSANAPLPWPEALRRFGLIAGAMALTVSFTAPFLYAPLVLLDRGGRLGGALLESAALMRRTGVLPHLVLSFLAQLLCLSPALLSAVVVARTMERAATPLGILLALPFLPLTIPLGLGMVTSAYVLHEKTLGDRRRAQQQPSLPLAHRLVLIIDVLAPLVGLALIGATALLPAGPRPGTAPAGEVLTTELPAPSFRVPDTSLEIGLQPGALRMVSGHEEPLLIPWTSTVEGLRILRLPQSYAVELTGPSGTYYVEVDAAGTRVDDSVRRRLAGRTSGWFLFLFLLGFAVVSLGSPAFLAPAGQARAQAARRVGLDAQARMRSFRMGIAMLPFALLAAGTGALVFFSG